jgi:hypothetical protein
MKKRARTLTVSIITVGNLSARLYSVKLQVAKAHTFLHLLLDAVV